MADDPVPAQSNKLIAGRFAVDTSQALLEAGGGVPAYLARDRQAADGRRAALAVARDASPRARHLKLLTDPIDNLMMPLGQGVAPMPAGKGEGYFIVCTFPSGAPLSAGSGGWPERALLDLVLRPIATVLDELHGYKLTHRAIRTNNVFQAAPGQPVMLGAAWAAPPAMHQPAVFESPYNAMCHPMSRGDGSIADDVYSLAVLLLALLAGRVPMANMDDTAIIRAKLDAGSFTALTRDIPVSGSFADMLYAMLTEDPEHRPLPAMLQDLSNTRGRRIAARPARRSPNPLMMNDFAIVEARTLAYALAGDEKRAIQFLRNGLVTQWLRRGLSDAGLATQIEDLVRSRVADTKGGPRGDPLMVMQTISLLNPLMPLCWRGISLWPDALASILAEGIASKVDFLVIAEELLINDIAGSWSAVDNRRGRTDPSELALQRQLFQGGGPGALLRLFYGINPLLPCRVPAMAKWWVANLWDLLEFFERVAGTAGDSLIDLHISAFIAARADRKIEMQVNAMGKARDADSLRWDELNLLQDLQIRYHPTPLPGLAKWVAVQLRPDLERWRNKPRREAMKIRLDALAQAGILSRMLTLITDPGARALDVAGAQRAANELALIDAEVAAIDHDDKLRFADAERFGQAVAGGIGLSVLILVVMSVLLR